MGTQSTGTKINSINYMRIICAVLVVAIHAKPLYDVNNMFGFIATDVLTRIAVPFFFVVSGFFFTSAIKKANDAISYLKKYLLRLFVTYTIWSAVYFCINLIQAIRGNYFSIKSFIVDCVIRYFFLGAYYHLWFYPSLILAVVFAFVFIKVKKFDLLFYFSVLLFILSVLACSYNNVFSELPVFSRLFSIPYFDDIRRTVLMGLPFFTLGGKISSCKTDKINQKVLYALTAVCAVLFVSELFVVKACNLGSIYTASFILYPLTLLVMFLCIKNPMLKLDKYSNECRKISSFIYGFHPIVLLIMKSFVESGTITFIVACLVSFVLGAILLKVNNKYINYLF